MRNNDKIATRSKMDPKELAPIEERNRNIYGNKVGPTAEDLFGKKKASLEKKDCLFQLKKFGKKLLSHL